MPKRKVIIDSDDEDDFEGDTEPLDIGARIARTEVETIAEMQSVDAINASATSTGT